MAYGQEKKKTLTLNLFSKKKDKFVSSYGTLRFIKHIFYSSPDSEAGIRKRLHRGFDCVVLVIPKNIKRKYIILCILHGKERKRVLVFSSSYRDSNLILEALPSWLHLNLISSPNPLPQYHHTRVRAST